MKDSSSKKHFAYGKGNYYLNIKEFPRNILLFRKSREDAQYIFNRYKNEGKTIEWMGCWNGKKFEDTSVDQ